MENNEQTLMQRKIALAQSEHAMTIIELMKDVIVKGPVVGDSEYATVVNAVRLDTQGDMLNDMMQLIQNIRNGVTNQIQK